MLSEKVYVLVCVYTSCHCREGRSYGQPSSLCTPVSSTPVSSTYILSTQYIQFYFVVLLLHSGLPKSFV